MDKFETIVHIRAYSLEEYEQFEGIAFPGGDLDFDTPFTIAFAGGFNDVYIGTNPRATIPSDVPSNQIVYGGFDGKINYGIRLFEGVDPSESKPTSVEGSLSLGPEKELNVLMRYILDGAKISILKGKSKDKISNFDTIANVTSAGLMIGKDTKDLSLRDLSWLLNTPIHDLYYAGTGGLEGPVSLANVWKPILVGYKEKVGGVNIDPERHIYQVSCGRIESVVSVQIGGAEVTNSNVDYATFEELIAAKDASEIENGTYATCHAHGLFALGGAATKPVTASVKGDSEILAGLGYADKRADIIRRVVTCRGSQRLLDSDIDIDSFNAVNSNFPEICGWYWDSEITKSDALTEIMRGILGVWYMTLPGQLTLWWLREPPSAENADYELVHNSMEYRGDANVLSVPELTTKLTSPRKRTDLAFSKNHVILSQDQLAGEIVSTNKALDLSLPYRTVTNFSTWFSRVTYKTSANIIETGFVDEESTSRESKRAQTLLGVRRFSWEMKTSFKDSVDIIGKSIVIRGFPELGLDNKVTWCIGSKEENGLLILTLWS